MLQVKKGTYDVNANLALFRLYNFAPEKANIQAMATVLIKAQMQLPNHDFAQLLHLIPERLQVHSHPQIPVWPTFSPKNLPCCTKGKFNAGVLSRFTFRAELS